MKRSAIPTRSQRVRAKGGDKLYRMTLKQCALHMGVVPQYAQKLEQSALKKLHDGLLDIAKDYGLVKDDNR